MRKKSGNELENTQVLAKKDLKVGTKKTDISGSILRRVLINAYYELTGEWMDKKIANLLVYKLNNLPTEIILNLIAEVKSGVIKKNQHPNYYTTILWRRLNDHLTHAGERTYGFHETQSIKDIINQVLFKPNQEKSMEDFF